MADSGFLAKPISIQFSQQKKTQNKKNLRLYPFFKH